MKVKEKSNNAYLHSRHIVLQRHSFVAAGRGMVAKEIGQLLAVLAVLVDPELHILAELFVKLLVVFRVLCNLVEELETLFDDVFADDLEDLALLEHLSRDVEREILRVDDTLDEIEVLWDQLFAVFHDEHTSDVQLDVVLHLAILKQVKGGAFRDEKERTELELALDGKVLHGEMVFPVVCQRLVELSILVLRDIVWVSSPDGLHFVQLLEFVVFFLDLLFLLLVLVLVFVGLFVVAYIFQLSLVLGRSGGREREERREREGGRRGREGGRGKRREETR